MKILYYCAIGIIYKELLRFFNQKGRFFSALVRPLLWLFIFSVGFRSVLGLSITPPYETYITYDTYIIAGLIGMILLFNSMQSSLAMIFDREMGSMKILLTSFINRNFLLFMKMIATAIVSTIQAIVFLFIVYLYGIDIPPMGYITVIPAIILTSIILNAFAIFISSIIKHLENFASVMNFVIFPMFFLSSALYPLWRVKDSSIELYWICYYNFFTHIVEFIRFSLYSKSNYESLAWLIVSGIILIMMAFLGYDSRKILKKSGR